MLTELLIGLMLQMNIIKPSILEQRIDSFAWLMEGEDFWMSCFQMITLQEKYGDALEQSVPLDPSVISYDDLRYVTVLHLGYDGFYHIGELIVHASVAQEVLAIFKELYCLDFPIEKMQLMSCYNGVDEWSMEDNNSSAFNFREVTDGGKLSKHAYGLAIDLNPKVNPYIKADVVLPSNGLDYVDREQAVLGMIKKGDAVYEVFKRYGWTWGGDWSRLKDYQHFEK